MLLSRQPVLHTHDELYMQTLIDKSAVHKPSCTVDVGSKISIAGSTLSFRICVAKPSTSGAILMKERFHVLRRPVGDRQSKIE